MRRLRLESLEDRRLLALTTDTFSAGVLTVNFNGADQVAISSSGGDVLVNGASPTTGAATVGSVTAINITGTGNFDNTIDLSGVSAATGFSNLSSVTIAAGGAVNGDTVSMGPLNASGAVNISSSGASQITLAAGLAAGSVTITPASASTIVLDGSVTTSGAQDYGAAVSLQADAVLSAGSGNVTFNNTVDGDHNLTINSSGVTTFDGALGTLIPLSSLTTDAPGSTVASASLNVYGSITIDDPLTLASNVTLDVMYHASGSNNFVSIGSTTDGPYGLTIASQNVALTGAIGSTTPLASLVVGSDLGLSPVYNDTFRGGSITTTGPQTFNVQLSLDANTTFSAGSSAIQVLGGLTGDSATFDTTGLTGLDTGEMAATINVSSLTTNAAGTTTIVGIINTTGNQTYNNPVTVEAAQCTSTGGNIVFNATVDGEGNYGNLTTSATGTTTFNGAVGKTSPLGFLQTDAGGTTILAGGSIAAYQELDSIKFGNPVVLASDMTLTTDADVEFDGTVDGAHNLSLTEFPGGLMPNAEYTFVGAVGSTTPLSSLVTSGRSLNLNGVATTGSQIYNNKYTELDGSYTSAAGPFITTAAATLLGNTVINAPGGISLGTVDGAYGLNLVSENLITLAGQIGHSTAVASVMAVSAAGEDIDANVTTTGNQTYSLPVTLGQGVNLASTAGTVSQVATVNTAPVLTPIGTTLQTANLNDVGSTPVSVGTMVGNSITDDTGLYGIAVVNQSTPGGSWQYSLNGGTTWANFGAASNTQSLLLSPTDLVRFAPDGTHTGTATFTYRAWSGVTGTAGTLANTTTNGGTSNFSTATDTTSIAVQVAPMITTDTFSAGVLTVDVDGPQNLTITTSGGLVLVNGANPSTGSAAANAVTSINIAATAGNFDNIIDLSGVSKAGGFTALASVAINTGGSHTGDQVTLGELDASGALTISGAGTDTVTSTGALIAGSVSITSTSFSASSVTTTGNQTYNAAINVVNYADFFAGSGNVTFNGTIDGQGGLTTDTTGTTTFNAPVGSKSTGFYALGTDAGTTVLAGGSIAIAQTVTFENPVVLESNTSITAGFRYYPNTSIDFASTVDGAFDLIADSDGLVDFGGAVGGSVPLTSIISGGSTSPTTGTTEIDAPVTTSGAQTYNHPVSMQSAGSINESVNLAAGTFTLSCLAAQGTDNQGTQSLQLSVDGTPVGSAIAPSNSTFSLAESIPFTVAAGTHSITIAGNPQGGGNAALVQDIAFQPIVLNQISDPDFSTVSVGANNWQYGATGSPWLFTGGAGLSGNGGAVAGGNPAAPQGSQVAFLQQNASVSQSVDMSAGTYELDFLATQRGNYNQANQVLQVLVDGVQVGSNITPAGPNYALYATATFTVLAGMHTITIESVDPNDLDQTALVDAVAIHPVTTNLLADADFSAAIVGAGGWQIDPSGSPWTFTGTAGVSDNNSPITSGNPAAPQGSQVAFLQGSGSISQTVSLSDGTYTIDFQAAQSANENVSAQSLQVSVDGTPIGASITPANSIYAAYSTATFTVSGGTHTITITGLDPQGDNDTALVTGVSIQSTTTNQLTDPDFSATTVGAGNWQYAPNGSAWIFAGTAGVSGNGGAIAGGNPAAPQGSQVAFVQGTGSISQAVSLSAGTYTIDFEAAQRGNYNFGGQSVQVLIDGSPIDGSITPASANYATYSTETFSVTAGTHTVTIVGLDPKGGDNTALVSALSIQPTAANQLADPDFSGASVGAGSWQYTPSGSPWIFTGTAGVSGNGSAITEGNPAAPQGTQVAFLQGTGSISQAVILPAGTYVIEFEAAQRENYNFGGQSLQVSIDGTPLAGSITPTGSDYSLYGAAVFTVTAGSHTITIAGLNPHGGDNTALVSAVSIQAMTANQIADPNFGAASVGNGNWQYAPSGSPWLFTGSAGVSGNGGAIAGGNPAAPQGSQVAFLQGTGSISQAVSLSAGTYTIEFAAAQRGNYNFGGQSLQVSIDGTPLGGSITPTGSNYAAYSTATFSVTAGTHIITFAGLNPHGGDNTALVGAVSIQPPTVNQLADPDFSATNITHGNWQYGPSGSGWEFIGTAGVSGDGSGITAGNPNAPQGSVVAFLQGTGSISQAVSLPAGTYTIEFQAAQRGNYNFGGQSVQVLVDGTPIGASITPADSNYAAYSTATFSVTAGTHIITFAGLNPHGGDNTALVGAVSIQATTANQLADSDFSAANVGAGNWQYAPSGSPWLFTGSAGVSGNGGAIAGGNPNAPQGSQVAFLQDTGSISQPVSLPAGTYTIEFEAAQRGNYNFGGQSLQVSVDGTPLGGSITPAGSAYSPYATAVFTVTAGSHLITIAGLNPHGSDNTALVSAISIQPTTANQLADPDFSAATVGAGNWQYAPSGSPWFFTGSAGESGNGGAIAGGNPAAPQGSQVAFLQGTGSVSQAVNLPAGTYTVELEAAQRGNYNFGGQSLQVSIDGTPLAGSFTPAGSDYSSYVTAVFTVTAGSHDITIAGLNPLGGDNTALVDDVRIVSS